MSTMTIVTSQAARNSSLYHMTDARDWFFIHDAGFVTCYHPKIPYGFDIAFASNDKLIGGNISGASTKCTTLKTSLFVNEASLDSSENE